MKFRIITALTALAALVILFVVPRTNVSNHPTDLRDAPLSEWIQSQTPADIPEAPPPPLSPPAPSGEPENDCRFSYYPCLMTESIVVDLFLQLKHPDCNFGGFAGGITGIGEAQKAACKKIENKAYKVSEKEALCENIHKDLLANDNGRYGSMNLKTSRENCNKDIGDKNAWFDYKLRFRKVEDANSEFNTPDVIPLQFKLSAAPSKSAAKYAACATQSHFYHFELSCSKRDGGWRADFIRIKKTTDMSYSHSVSASVGASAGYGNAGLSVSDTVSNSYSVDDWAKVPAQELNALCGTKDNAAFDPNYNSSNFVDSCKL